LTESIETLENDCTKLWLELSKILAKEELALESIFCGEAPVQYLYNLNFTKKVLSSIWLTAKSPPAIFVDFPSFDKKVSKIIKSSNLLIIGVLYL